MGVYVSSAWQIHIYFVNNDTHIILCEYTIEFERCEVQLCWYLHSINININNNNISLLSIVDIWSELGSVSTYW